MVRTTKAQRQALKRLYDREPMLVTYRQFRQRLQGTFGSDKCVMVKWCGMWIGIEEDGYTHS
jgi:hypothetical protein